MLRFQLQRLAIFLGLNRSVLSGFISHGKAKCFLEHDRNHCILCNVLQCILRLIVTVRNCIGTNFPLFHRVILIRFRCKGNISAIHNRNTAVLAIRRRNRASDIPFHLVSNCEWCCVTLEDSLYSILLFSRHT